MTGAALEVFYAHPRCLGQALGAMGFRLRDDTTGGSPEADVMHALLVQRAEELEGCTEGSAEEQELSAIVSAILAYEEKRWPEGKTPGGKG